MTYDSRVRPQHLRPTNTDGDLVADGTYIVTVVGSKVTGWTQSSAVVPLPAGSDASDVPADTPDKSLIIVKA